MYTISFEISAFLLSTFSFIYCVVAKHRQYIPPKGIKNKMTNQHFLFLLMLLTNMLSSVASVTGVQLTAIASPSVAVWQYIFHALYFIFHSTLSLAFALYIMSVTGTNFNNNKVLYFLLYVPYLVAEILILTNHWTSWAFYMDQEYIYHRGPLMLLLYGIGAFYVIVGFVFFLKNKKAISKVDSIAVATFIIIATLGIIVQAIWSSLLVELFCESLACLVIMMVLEEKTGHIDVSTGLLNRLAFVENSRRYLVNKQSFDLVILKITDLDTVTKRFSVRASDEFLMRVASFLKESAKGEEVYCYRKEEFAILLKESNAERTSSYANRVIERFQKEWDLDSISISVDAIAAVISVPSQAQSLEEIEDLLSVNYQKSQSGSYIVPFSEIGAMMKVRVYEDAIRDAIKNNGFLVKFQPIWSIKEKATISAEALLRANSPELKNLSPEIYIPIAEKTGLIREIGLFVFEEVCKFLRDERIKNTRIRYVELNLSVYQFLQLDLVESFEEIRQRYGVPSEQLNLEITETEGALESSQVLETLQRFRELGYTLSLDDFGTGYSNFVRMIKCKFENIKIDKSILWNLSGNENDIDIIKNLMLFIKNQGSYIIQEGVENDEQLALISECGCDYVQGFYFSGAIAKDDFFSYLTKEAALDR